MPKFLNDSGLSHLIDKIKSLFKRTHQEIGINIWDEEWRVGMYDSDNGKFVSNSIQRVASVNFIPIIPSEKYWATYTVVGINLYFYDKNRAFISAMTNLSPTQFPITVPSTACYMTFDLHSSYGTTYKNDTCINVSDSDINGTYYPYRGLRKQITEVSENINRIENNNVNQMLEFRAATINGVVFSFDNLTKKVSMSGTATGGGGRTTRITTFSYLNMIIGHKYYMKNTTTVTTMYLSLARDTTKYVVFPVTSSKIFDNTTLDGDTIIGFNTTSGTTYNTTGCVELIDLTQWFGKGNEPPSIQEIEVYLNKEFYDYTDSLPSVKSVYDDALNFKMLGWSIPPFCTVKNTRTPDNVFHKNVNRLRISEIEWSMTSPGIFMTSQVPRYFASGSYDIFSGKYRTIQEHSTAASISSLVATHGNGIYVNAGSGTFYIADSAYSTAYDFMQANVFEYIYYRHSEETFNIDDYSCSYLERLYHFNDNSTRTSGYYLISINDKNSWMSSFTVRVYASYISYDMDVCGYNYASQDGWYNPKFRLRSTGDQPSVNVTVGYYSRQLLWLAIPAMSYGTVDVVNVSAGFQGSKNISNLFTIKYVNSLPGTTQSTYLVRRQAILDDFYGKTAVTGITSSFCNSITAEHKTVGNVTHLQISFKATSATTDRAGYLSGINPVPARNVAITAFNATKHISHPALLNTAGSINLYGSIAIGDEVCISADYFNTIQ